LALYLHLFSHQGEAFEAEPIERRQGTMLRLFVGNIPHSCGEAELQRWFEEHGHSVTFAQVIRDRVTGHSRGFGFVELQDAWDLKATVERLNGQRLAGRVLTVNAATPRVPGGSAVHQVA